ncbi:MAG: spore germination protein [Bacillota bacterium]
MWNKIKSFLGTTDTKQDNLKQISTSKDRIRISKNLASNLEQLKNNLAPSMDLNYKNILLGGTQGYNATVIYIVSIVNQNHLQQEILKPLMLNIKFTAPDDIEENIQKLVCQLPLPIGQTEFIDSINQAVEGILAGKVVIFIKQFDQAFMLDIKELASRAVSTPQIESSTRGPQEAFTENLEINISLIRKRLRDNNLMIKSQKLGTRTKTDLGILYIDGLADQEILEQLENRIANIDLDGVIDTGYLDQYFQDNWKTPFPIFQNTERPDKAIHNLLEGKILLILDGTPFVSVIPTTFIQFFQTPEDYYDNFYVGSAIRILRLIATFITISLPSLYISLVSFHHELLPTDLALTIATTRQEVPFPSYLEALIMELSLELLRESGIRLPGAIGQTIGIVGGLVLGEAAVNAGLVSPPMVIVVAITAISSFVIPDYEAAIPLRLLRFPLMILASFFSIYGIMIGWLFILIHLCSLESFNQPYFAPFAPIKFSDLKDSIIRVPLRFMGERPYSTANQEKDRQDRKGESTDEK